MPLGKLKEGDRAEIVHLDKGDLSLKFLEMGFLPVEKVEVDKIAPLGDPISVKIGTYLLSIRREEANAIMVRK